MWPRWRSLLLKIEIQFPLNNFSLLRPIDTKLAVCVAYIKTQLRNATQVSVIKVKFIFIKKEIQFLLDNLSLLLPIDYKLGAFNQCNQNNDIIFFTTAIFHFLFLSHRYLVKLLKTWFCRIVAFLVFTLNINQNNSGHKNEMEVTGILTHVTSRFRYSNVFLLQGFRFIPVGGFCIACNTLECFYFMQRALGFFLTNLYDPGRVFLQWRVCLCAEKGQRTFRADFGLTDLTYESYAILYLNTCRKLFQNPSVVGLVITKWWSF